MPSLARFAGALLFPPLIAAAWFSVRLARADAEFRRATPEAVARAVELAPLNADYLLLRAMQLDYDGADPAALLEQAARLNPANAAPLLRLGLAAEIRGDLPGAEKYLLDAARVNHQFEPRWTLANFYFRHANPDQFWPWMRSALDISYGDRRPAFELCWNASADASEILARAIPPRREVLRDYLEYLSETHRPAALLAPALGLTKIAGPADRPALLGTVDALIAANDATAAVTLWRALGYANPPVFRSDFEPPEVGAGFDWHFSEGQGIAHLAIDQPHSAHRISLSGSQPESAELLSQTMVLQPRARYQLAWQARTQGISSPTGIEWWIGDQHAPVAANENGGAGEFEFVAPAALAPLRLVYSRPNGETRAEGSIELWRVSITPN